MNAMNDFDRVLEGWFRADAPVAAPSDLVVAIARATATTRRRPGWLVPARWMPRRREPPAVLRYALLAALALFVATATVLVVGSRPRVPAPFGPARPGLFAMTINGNIVTMAPNGSMAQPLTTDDAWDSNPAFSRDGTHIALWSRPVGSAASELVVMGSDGSGRHVVARADYAGWCESSSALYYPNCDGPGRGLPISWSPDSTLLAYSFDAGNQSQIFVARADAFGSTPVGDPALKGQNPAWSPDGSMIAFSGGASDDVHGLYLMRADGTEIRRLSTGPGIAGAFTPTWSPDGRRLAFAGSGGKTTLFVVNSDGTDEHQVDGGESLSGASWSPDGTRMAWLHAESDLGSRIYVAGADGRDIRAIPIPGRLPGAYFTRDSYSLAIGWSADGKQVIGIVTSDAAMADGLIQVDPGTGASAILPAPGLWAWTQQRLAP